MAPALPQVRQSALQTWSLTIPITSIIQVPVGNQVETTRLKEIEDLSNAQEEIPYVPASQRPTRQEETDTIVVVGQVHKKRKRKAERTVASDQDVTSSAKPEETFDFSSVPNILDDDPEAGKEEGEETGKKRKRQKKTNKKGL